MYYVYQYELVALIFLIIIAVRFFNMRRFPNAQNRLFSAILIVSVADLTLDIVGSFMIAAVDVLPAWSNYLVNSVFYALQLSLIMLMLSYALLLTGCWERRRLRAWLLSPGAACLLLLASNIWTGVVFVLEPVNGVLTYVHSPGFYALYVCLGVYLAITVALVFIRRRFLREKEFSAICAFLTVVLVAAVIQIIYPQLLLTGVAISMAILMMFLVLQNPEDMLDLITGVFNYIALTDFLSGCVRKKRRLWLIAVDVGGVRRLNSVFGLERGNEALAQVGAFLAAREGKNWPFRMIGTRFLLVVSNDDDYQRIIREVDARFQQPWMLHDIEISLSATVRYFSEPNSFTQPEQIIDMIDLAYTDGNGWSTSRAIDSELIERAQRTTAVESALRHALDGGSGFSLRYQPLYDFAAGRCVTAEALLRLDDPQLGSVSPAEFIPIAERTGLIFRIDDWVVAAACDMLRRRADALPGLERLEVNLSAAEFINYSLYSRINDIVSASGVAPQRLCFEVTETAATVYHSLLLRIMNDMRQDGFTFALDDFGSGYANLTQALSLPFAMVKLDRSLLAENCAEQLLLKDLIVMLHHQRLEVVVEGAETAEQLELVRAGGADLVQGYYYSRPLSEDAFVDFLHSRR